MRRLFFPLLLALVLLCFAAVSPASAGKLVIGPDQTYLVLAAERKETLERELQVAAANGFHIWLSHIGVGEMVLLMRRDAMQPDNYQYRLITHVETETMQEMLNDAGEDGYRLVGDTIGLDIGRFGVDLVAIVERRPDETERYRYEITQPGREAPLSLEERLAPVRRRPG